ncbi:MAG: DegT/DnrJ/EryC1/StrS family aminotransferase [Candidatus Levyibacteriota bacterium]
MKRPIAISLSPNTKTNDVFLAFRLIFSPWTYINGNYPKVLEQWFRNYFKVSNAISFASGRGALLAILKTLGIGLQDEVIIQAFTCVAVCDPIIKTGAKPIFADINNSLTMDAEDLEKKITAKTKAIIVQHTFGIPSDLNKILAIAKNHGIAVIEDCAHIIGGKYKDKRLGTFGDASFFSFGRDKAFSSVFGGMAITDNELLGKKIRIFCKQQKNPSYFWVAQQLFHPIAFYFILPIYNFFAFGKFLLIFFQKLKLLSLPVSSKEKQGGLSLKFARKLPNAFACLAIFQLKKINEYNQKREAVADYYLKNIKNKEFIFPYQKSIPFLRFPILADKRDEIINFFKRKGIYLGKWYSETVGPKGVSFKSIYYRQGLCPNAELIAKKIINLPTYPVMEPNEEKKIVNLLENYVKDSRN